MPEFELKLPENEGFTTIQNLRRSELLRLAQAYGIQHPLNCSKEKLLPLIHIYLHATPDGRIESLDKKPPVNPEYLLPPGDRPESIARRAKAWGKKTSLTVKWRGGAKWSVMDGETVVSDGMNKEEAVAACG